MKQIKYAYISLLLIPFNSCISNGEKVKVAKLNLEDSLNLIKYAKLVDVSPLYSLDRQKYLDSVLMIVPKNAYAWQQKAMPLFKQKKYELGMSYLDSAVKYDKTDHYLEYRAFVKCIFQKNYKGAIEDFKSVSKLKGNAYVMDHTYEFYVGLCHLQLNQFEQAEKLFSKNIEEDRKKLGKDWINCTSLFYQGICFYELGLTMKAIQSFENSLEHYNNFIDAKYYKAICLLKLDKKKEALVLLESAQNDLKKDFSFPETNAVYETYPYQVNSNLINQFKAELEGQR
nr:tetratricopeptide repeat protein [uncultured Sphingobacterium sp.]